MSLPRPNLPVVSALLAICLADPAPVAASPSLANLGPLFDEFELTLEEGRRTEAAAFLWSQEDRGEEAQTWAVSPLCSQSRYPMVDAAEFDFLYPLFTYDRFGSEWRWQFLQILNFSEGHHLDESIRSRLTLFPIYFHQRATDPGLNYTAVWPLAGRLRHRLFYAEVDFLLWPILVKTKRAATVAHTPEDDFTAPFFRWREERRVDVTTYNFLAPFFHYRTGPGLRGWQAWPLVGWEDKEISHRTNHWGETVLVPGFHHRMLFWPLFASQDRKLGTANEERFRAFLPFYSLLRSPARDSSTYLWPIGLTLTDDRARKYYEVGAPWPLIVFAHGEGKTTARIFPFYSHSQSASLQSDFLLWPIYKFNAVRGETLERTRSRILWFLYSDTLDLNKQTGKRRRRIDCWPLFVHSREFDGRTRLQVLAPIEPLLPGSKSIERNYSPVWSVWRAEQDPATGAASQSLLWNLYRHESRPTGKKCSLLFGLFQYESGAQGRAVRLCFIPLTKAAARPQAAGAPGTGGGTGSADQS